jgi:hypothetical protein
MTATVNNNTVSNLLGGADGIGLYVGTSGTLNLAASGNTITGAGDEALSIEMRGNAIANANIASNTLQTASTKSKSNNNPITDAIQLTIGDDTPSTGVAGSGTSSFTITDNTIGITKQNAGDEAKGLEIRLFGAAQPSAPINLTFNIIGNAITSPNGDVIKLTTPATSGYTNTGNTINANILNNTLNRTATSIPISTPIFSDYAGFRFESQATYFTNTLSIKNNNFNISGDPSKTYAIDITQSGSGALSALFAGNTSPVVTTPNNNVIRLNQNGAVTSYNIDYAN